MSTAHFQSLQEMIKQLEAFGYKDVTDAVKPSYQGEYYHLCTLQRPAPEQEKGPIYCTTIEELVTLLEQVNPSLLEMQVWFCENCRAVSAIRYRKRAGYTEVAALLNRDHQIISPTCSVAPSGLLVINPSLITSRSALDRDTTIPEWTKGRLFELLFDSKERTNTTIKAAKEEHYK